MSFPVQPLCTFLTHLYFYHLLDTLGSLPALPSLPPQGGKKWKSPSRVQLCDPMDFSMARILEWVDVSFFRGPSKPRDWTQVSCIAGRFFSSWATRAAHHSGEWGHKRGVTAPPSWHPGLNSTHSSFSTTTYLILGHETHLQVPAGAGG